MPTAVLQGLHLQPRDFALLRGLFESRVMTLAQLSALYFDGKREMAKKRVQKLKLARIVRERPRMFGEPSILFLGRRAFEILRTSGHLSDYPHISINDLEKRAAVSNLTLRHELEVMDVKVAMLRAICATNNFRLMEFATWPLLYRFRACGPDGQAVTVRPDGFLRLHEVEPDGGLSEHCFFLEVDRSTESLDVLTDRCSCYSDYYRSGGFALRHGGARGDYKSYPFRVIVICRSEQRRDNLIARLRNCRPPIVSQVIAMTTAQFRHHPLGPLQPAAS
jgi:hypothetical protein